METVRSRVRARIDFLPTAHGFQEIGVKTAHFLKRRPWLALVIAMFVLVGVIYQFTASAVIISVDGETVLTARSYSRTVNEVLQELGVELHPKDMVIPAQSCVLRPETKIEIMKAFPVFVIADNAIAEIWTAPVAVKDFLHEEGYILGPDDRVEADSLTGMVSPMIQLKIVRVKKLYETQNLPIPFEDVVRGDRSLDRGLLRVVSEGQDGYQEQLVEIVYEDGEEVSRSVVETTVLESPVNRVIEQGENTSLVRDGRAMLFDRVIIMTATSYCPGTPESGCPTNSSGHAFCTGSDNNGYTYTGKRAVQGLGTIASPRIVAVDPRVIPLGSMLYIEEIPGIGKIGFARAEDIGGAIKGNKIDILYDKHSDVAKFGLRRGVKVYVLTSY
ncbi:MAG: G5 domain-containing protein [Bacillota bacterium]